MQVRRLIFVVRNGGVIYIRDLVERSLFVEFQFGVPMRVHDDIAVAGFRPSAFNVTIRSCGGR